MKFKTGIFVLAVTGTCILPLSASAMGRKPSEEIEILPSEQSAPVWLTLGEGFALALKRSEVLAMRKEEIEKTEGQFLRAASEAIGDADFVMSHTYQEPQKADGSTGGSSIASTFVSSLRRERKFTYSQPLFQGFKSVGALVGAGSLRSQRKQEWRYAEDLLFLDVVQAFYDLLSRKKDVEVIEEIEALLRDRIKELEARVKIGRSRESELATARAELKRLQAAKTDSQGLVTLAEDVLEFLTGVSVQAGFLRDEEWVSGVDGRLEEYLKAVRLRPDVEAARQAMRTAKQGIVVAQSGLWPKVSLDLNQYEKREGFQSGIDWDLLLKVDVPLSRGGENLGKLKESWSDWKKSKYAYALTKREAALQIKKTFHNWNSTRDQFKALGDAGQALDENYRLQQDEYKRNLVNNLDVLAALKSLLETRRETNRVYYELKENYWRLQVAVGNYREYL